MNLRRILAAASLVVAGGIVAASPAHAAVSCEVVYTPNSWQEGPSSGGFTTNITVRNTGDAWQGWTLAFTLPAGQTLTPPGWSATFSASGQNVTAVPVDWNRNLATGQSTQIGFQGRWTGSYTNPTAFTVNGVACNGPGGGLSVALTRPTSGETFPAGQGVPLAATVSGGTAARVEFFVDGVMVATDTSSPYTGTANGLAAGSHVAQARAFNSAGSSVASANVPFTVQGTGTPSILLSPTDLSVAEGASAALTVRLSQAPSANVTVQLARTGDASITVPATVTVTTANWSTGVTANVSAAEDADTTNGTATINATATGYTAGSASVTEVDNDGNPTARVPNPYAGAGVYNNPDWRARAAAEPGGSRIANQPTGVWMDRRAAINGTPGARGLASHLDEAVAQDAANGAAPLVFQVVIYNLPGRDCAALASNGELGPNDLPIYQAEYIDPIAAILARPAYANLRIVTVIEIDSLPNLVTNISGRPTASPACDVVNANGAYVNGVGYALNKLGDIPNVYNYIDAAHHGWIGWSDNFGATAQKLAQAANANGATPADVHGFITNTANYSALTEPYINVQGSVGGQQIRQSAWVDFNNYNEELAFAQSFRNQLISAGFNGGGNDGIGMLIDTSRNGWGNCVQAPCPTLANRPTGPSSSTNLNEFVNQSRIDRRIHKGNWCNQTGAGLGERPRANPATGIDAYVWIKPPGESDGSSRAIPNNEGKGWDQMCDERYTGNVRNGNNMSGALPDSPLSGHWFSAQFRQLMANAYPPL
ncbi:glycoside hydrolase family 6 protein [Allorhizocola rhizosphaerae]|uniref:glycoside hydrolase family 6 protein n=1 Tax=Allorhizocola rhizosphaerae TaxID=1872709 RepID=UPI000E3DE983|nr:glycoside hydrolase family 6 protein [Allorhizocola rhizosphaerae]